ncbi:Pecanex-like protein 1 [Geodia barretti]|uniref:Pecanex-like protein n=1 Tax=Geodia barretti TaxID=519541 RepID=A0AA35XDG1_GEOBA|nr:Pecanex-like protein 1 [Geodia barretti]
MQYIALHTLFPSPLMIPSGAALVLTVAGMKLFRSSFTELSRQYLVFIFTLFFFNFDYRHLSEGLPLDYLIIGILFSKFYDLLLKMYFIFIYIAPWQISWSSPGHIIAQPLLVPHAPNIFFQTLIASIVGCPINPVVASTFFTLSYARPVKYWEKDYNTRRSDSSNTRLDSQLEGSLRNPNPDQLDSLFYEHLTWVLQKSLCGDLLLGRWGRVTSGDFFILTSDRLNALVHIIEIGNGFVTFQLRGLEFRGTYCHQREVEAITESITDDVGCCCCEPGHLPFFLSCNKAMSSRWLAWEVVSSCYTLHGYSIAENQAHLVFNTFDYKRGYITYYCKSIIFLLVRSPRLASLLANQGIRDALSRLHNTSYVDQDALFDETRNCDYSHSLGGVSRERFIVYYLTFIRECVTQQGLHMDLDQADSFLVTLCFAFTLLGRRMFFQHAQSGSSRRGDNFMNGLYRMFLGDARPNHPGDEWVFQDVDSIQDIIIPAARIALKVHQDNFAFSEEYETAHGVYEAIQDVMNNHVVTHENDRTWRNAVVTNKPSLLALRYQRTEESYIYPYKLIRLTSKFIKFRVIKVNRECVRALWTSQRQELIFLRNSDSERGSIQNHKPTLRNMINSSMDLPIGYPIYVSPLHTSYLDRHETYNKTLFGRATDPLWLAQGARVVRKLCDTCAKHYQGSLAGKPTQGTANPTDGGEEGGREGRMGAEDRSVSVDSLTGLQYGRGGAEGGARGGAEPYQDPFPDSDSDSDEQLWRPMWVSKQVVITDEGEIFENINPDWLTWPDPKLAAKAEKSHWRSWRPQKGMEGEVVHEWRPFHKETAKRSHIDKVLVLVRMADDYYVLTREQGIKEV